MEQSDSKGVELPSIRDSSASISASHANSQNNLKLPEITGLNGARTSAIWENEDQELEDDKEE